MGERIFEPMVSLGRTDAKKTWWQHSSKKSSQ